MTPTRSASPSASVVLVNDDPVQLNLMARLLKEEGVRVFSFHTAEAALTAMSETPSADLVVTDLYMPGIDGWQFCRLLRSPEYAAFNRVPILVVSATFSGEEAARITADLGADAFLPLPVDGKRFLARVRALLSGELQRYPTRVLIVEDSRTMAHILKKSFEDHGYQAEIASTVQAAEAMFAAESYQVAVLDYHLPDRKGDLLLTAFRERRPECVSIMMTVDSRPDLALKWMKMGAAAYLRKPFEPEYLIELCAKARRERALMRVEDLLEDRTRNLRRREAFYRALLDGINDAVWIHEIGSDGLPRALIEVNPAACEMMGYTREELLTLPIQELIAPEEPARLSRAREKTVRHGSARFETIQKTRDGRLIPVESHVRVFQYDGRRLSVSLCRDMTAHKQMEAAMFRKSEEQRLLLDTIPTQVWYLSDIDTYGAVNRARAEFLGYAPREVAHKPVKAFLPPDLESVCKADSIRAFESRRPVHSEEWSVNAQGEHRLLSVIRTPKLNDAGEVEYLVCAGTDITETKQTEKALRDSEERFRKFFEAAQIGIALVNEKGDILAANPFICEWLGYSKTELEGLSVQDITHPEDFESERKVIQELRLGRQAAVRLEKRYLQKDGGVVWGDLVTNLVFDEEGNPLFGLGTVVDITDRKQADAERRRLERQIGQLEKAESLGRMAGAIAHRFNNHLFGVMGRLEMAIADTPAESRIHRNLAEALEAAQSAADVSGLMLTSIGQTAGNPGPFDLAALCREHRERLLSLLPEAGDLVVNLPDPGPVVCGVADQIREVLIQLVANARESYENGAPTVSVALQTISADQLESAHRYPVDWEPADARYACLTVADTGTGIAQEDMDRLFDPFFTRKFAGRGLGLAVVRGIVIAHGGAIAVESAPGRGSTFRVYLPVGTNPKNGVVDAEF